MKKQKIKTCMCGEEPYVYFAEESKQYFVYCSSCFKYGPLMNTREEAINNWNKTYLYYSIGTFISDVITIAFFGGVLLAFPFMIMLIYVRALYRRVRRWRKIC